MSDFSKNFQFLRKLAKNENFRKLAFPTTAIHLSIAVVGCRTNYSLHPTELHKIPILGILFQKEKKKEKRSKKEKRKEKIYTCIHMYISKIITFFSFSFFLKKERKRKESNQRKEKERKNIYQ
jgi:hypothetical protein